MNEKITLAERFYSWSFDRRIWICFIAAYIALC